LKASYKVLHVAWLKARYGGAHKYLDRLIQRLLEQKSSVALVVNEQALDRPFLQELEKQGVALTHLPLEESAEQSAIQLDELIKGFCPDLVHFNSGARQPRKLAECMASWDSRSFRSVFTMHLPLIRNAPNWGARMRAAIPYTHARQQIAGKSNFAKRFDRIISVSEKFVEINVRGLALDRRQAVSIPNGIDITKFCPPSSAREETASRPIAIGGCGGLVPQKRFDVLIDAVAKLDKGSVIVRIAGEGEERKRLQQRIEQYRLSAQVQLVGHQADVPAFLRQLDIFVMPSDYEAFPYSQLEAMATGLPSVVTDVGDLPLMVRDGKDGLVVPTSDISALATALESLVADELLRKRMGTSARMRVVQNYEQHACESQTLDLFESLLK